MRLLATLRASTSPLTTALFAHVLAIVDQPAPAQLTRVASR